MKLRSGFAAALASASLSVACHTSDTSSRSTSADTQGLPPSGGEAECKALGEQAQGLSDADLDTQTPQLVSRFDALGCKKVVDALASDVRVIGGLPDGVSPAVSDVISWWTGLADSDKASLTTVSAGPFDGLPIGSPTRVVARVIVATIQPGDREGEARRAERLEGIRERQRMEREGNQQIEHEARERDREIVAGDPTFDDTQSRPDDSLDY